MCVIQQPLWVPIEKQASRNRFRARKKILRVAHASKNVKIEWQKFLHINFDLVLLTKYAYSKSFSSSDPLMYIISMCKKLWALDIYSFWLSSKVLYKLWVDKSKSKFQSYQSSKSFLPMFLMEEHNVIWTICRGYDQLYAYQITSM